MKRMALLVVCLCAVYYFCCSSSTESKSKSQFDPPEDHTVSKEGAMHNPGLAKPLENCIDCHGDDLRGGMVQVSCYTCHGKKW